MPRKWPEQGFAVSIADEEITCVRPNGETQAISLSRLRDVHVETNDSGPWGIDVWFILRDTGGGDLSFPLGASGEGAVIDRLTRLPGFEMKGMNSTANARFLCWSADGGEESA